MINPDDVVKPYDYYVRARNAFRIATEETTNPAKRRKLIAEAQAAASIGLLMKQLPAASWFKED